MILCVFKGHGFTEMEQSAMPLHSHMTSVLPVPLLLSTYTLVPPGFHLIYLHLLSDICYIFSFLSSCEYPQSARFMFATDTCCNFLCFGFASLSTLCPVNHLKICHMHSIPRTWTHCIPSAVSMLRPPQKQLHQNYIASHREVTDHRRCIDYDGEGAT